MKRIPKKDSRRVLKHLKKAYDIIDKALEEDDNVTLDPEIAAQCVSLIGTVEMAINDSL